MRLTWIELRDFRNHVHTRLDDIPEGLIAVVGPNGEGKTNLLEAMHHLYALASPRTSSSAALVREGADEAYVRGEFQTRDGRVLVEIEVRRAGANRVQVDRSPLRRRRDLRRHVRAVLFGPFDVPGRDRRSCEAPRVPGRRRGLAAPRRTTRSSSGYDKVLRQRNRLLKEWAGGTAPPEPRGVGRAARHGRGGADGRRAPAPPSASPPRRTTPSGGSRATVCSCATSRTCQPDDDPAEAFRDQLAARRGDELQRRTSLVGPHRDDLELAVRDLGARAAGSHGETWASALSLRLAQATAVEAEVGEPPLLLVDDPYSALDPARRDRLAEDLAARGGQVVISVADEADLPAGAAADLGRARAAS